MRRPIATPDTATGATTAPGLRRPPQTLDQAERDRHVLVLNCLAYELDGDRRAAWRADDSDTEEIKYRQIAAIRWALRKLDAADSEAVAILRDLLGRHDEEHPGAAFEPDPGCVICTSGVTPATRDTGLCPMHRAERLLRTMEDS